MDVDQSVACAVSHLGLLIERSDYGHLVAGLRTKVDSDSSLDPRTSVSIVFEYSSSGAW